MISHTRLCFYYMGKNNRPKLNSSYEKKNKNLFVSSQQPTLEKMDEDNELEMQKIEDFINNEQEDDFNILSEGITRSNV